MNVAKKKQRLARYILLGTIGALIIFGGIIFAENYFQSKKNTDTGGAISYKPVLYLYPEQIQKTKVQLKILDGKIIADYPKYRPEISGWEVVAQPDGTLYNPSDTQEYSYLFWEADSYENIRWDASTGFVVSGTETREFLQKILPQIGLTPKEYNEFIVYWYPLLQNNPYNFIHFAGKQYTQKTPLSTSPNYDSLLRVFMVVKPLKNYREVTPQSFEHFERKGFTVVEWGGTIVE